MSLFDVNSFTNLVVDQANDTQRLPVPVGEYMAVVDKWELRQWKKRDDHSVGGLALDVTWSLDSDALKEQLGRQKVTVKQGIMLELTDGNPPALAMGKGQNADLGKLREALNLNSPGQPFTWSMLEGRPAKVSVSQRVDGDQIYAEVKRVAKL